MQLYYYTHTWGGGKGGVSRRNPAVYDSSVTRLCCSYSFLPGFRSVLNMCAVFMHDATNILLKPSRNIML